MADAVNVQAFEPYGGGRGARLSAGTSSTRVAIPGLSGGQQGSDSRVVLSNGGSVSAYVIMGGPTVVATTACLEILPGTKEVLKPPFVGTQELHLAAITDTGATSINVCSGIGT